MNREGESGRWRASFIDKLGLRVALRSLSGSLLVVAPNKVRAQTLVKIARECSPKLDTKNARIADGLAGVTKALAKLPDVCFMAQQADYPTQLLKRALEHKGVRVFLFAWDTDITVHPDAHLASSALSA